MHFEQLMNDSRGRYSPVIIRMIAQIRTEAPKYKYEIREYSSHLNGDENIPEDDVGLVRLAVASGAILVTTDSRLIEAIRTSGLQEKYNIQAISPELAMPFASP